jgi:hypothetical protein
VNALIKLLKGDEVKPVIVGFARGFAEAVVMGGLMAAAVYLTTANLHGFEHWLPEGLVAIRTIEGWADHIDPSTDRAPTS